MLTGSCDVYNMTLGVQRDIKAKAENAAHIKKTLQPTLHQSPERNPLILLSSHGQQGVWVSLLTDDCTYLCPGEGVVSRVSISLQRRERVCHGRHG